MDVSTAANGNELRLLMAHRNPYDVVVLDLMLPDANGLNSVQVVSNPHVVCAGDHFDRAG